MIFCECGFQYEQQPGEKCLSAIICPKCGRKTQKEETWMHKIGDMNMYELKKNEGHEIDYLTKRKLNDGY